jgi:competence protein ComEA
MALRTAPRSRTGTCPPPRPFDATGGPGRAPGSDGRAPRSDGRARHRRPASRGRLRRGRRAPAEAVRHRAGLLFPERVVTRGQSEEEGNGPPEEEPRPGGRPDAAPPAAQTTTGPAPRTTGWRERAALATRERLPVWVRTRCAPERRNVIALTALLVVAVAFATQHYWAGRTQPVRAPQVVRAEVPDSTAEPGGRPRHAAPGAAGTEIVVDVTGRVRTPGVRRLPAGSRVADALRAAGGVRPGTDTGGLNRARFLVDGEQVVVGGPAPVPGPATPGGAGNTLAPGAGPVFLNTATAEQFDTLPGVGPVLARHIIDYRTRHGGFRSVDELRQVNGIGDRRFADLRELVRP